MRARPEVLNTICPASVSHRTLPVNFDQDHLQLFQHEFEKDIPQSELLKFENVRVSAEGLIFKDSRILPQSFAYAFELDEWKRRSVLKLLVTNYFFRRPRKIEMEVLESNDWQRFRPKVIVVEDEDLDPRESRIVRTMNGYGYELCGQNVIILDKINEYFLIDRVKS